MSEGRWPETRAAWRRLRVAFWDCIAAFAESRRERAKLTAEERRFLRMMAKDIAELPIYDQAGKRIA